MTPATLCGNFCIDGWKVVQGYLVRGEVSLVSLTRPNGINLACGGTKEHSWECRLICRATTVPVPVMATMLRECKITRPTVVNDIVECYNSQSNKQKFVTSLWPVLCTYASGNIDVYNILKNSVATVPMPEDVLTHITLRGHLSANARQRFASTDVQMYLGLLNQTATGPIMTARMGPCTCRLFKTVVRCLRYFPTELVSVILGEAYGISNPMDVIVQVRARQMHREPQQPPRSLLGMDL